MQQFSGLEYLYIDIANQYGSTCANQPLYDKLTIEIDKLNQQIKVQKNEQNMQQMPANTID